MIFLLLWGVFNGAAFCPVVLRNRQEKAMNIIVARVLALLCALVCVNMALSLDDASVDE
jgi:hypothetical protein